MDKLLNNFLVVKKAGKALKFLNVIKYVVGIAAIAYVAWNVLFDLFNDPIPE